MPKSELLKVNLWEYAQKIRKIFDIEDVNDEKIDYTALERVQDEIERRRALFQYFVPDVFAPGRYDRRADVIDGGIYLLECLEKTGNQSMVQDLWAQRAGIKRYFRTDDLEEEMHGFMFYHPILNIIGMGQHLDLLIPSLIRHIRSFKGRKRKLDLNDYALIFLSSFSSMKPIEITPKIRKFLQQLNREIEKRPMVDAFNLKRCMVNWKYKNANVLHAQIKQVGFSIKNIFEKRVIGLETYFFRCPYPYHVRARFHKGMIAQNFMTAGKKFLQEIWTLIPAKEDWELLYRKFPPQTRGYRIILIPIPHQDPLKYFNPNLQDWIIPWNRIIEHWQRSKNEIEQIKNPIKVIEPELKPREDLIRIYQFLEDNGNIKNSTIRRHTKIPIETIKQIRRDLEMKSLVARMIILFYHYVNDTTIITIPGDETWKYRLLCAIGDASIHYTIGLVEDVVNLEKFLMGHFLFTPQQGIIFHKTVDKIFRGFLDYYFMKQMLQTRLMPPWADLFDKETQDWKWNPQDYTVIPQ